MTFHTRAATDEIYSIFNQPLKTETVGVDNTESVYGSDYEDDDYTSAGESTGTGRVSVTTSEFGDDETSALKKTHRDADEHFDDQTRAESVGGEWTEFSPSKHVPSLVSMQAPHSYNIKNSFPRSMSPVDQTDGVDGHFDVDISSEASTFHHRTSSDRFIPQMPDDYDPPSGLYRDPATLAQNRLPFMTPITEKTESSLPTMTAARNKIYETKTPTGSAHHRSFTPPGLPPIGDLLLSSPTKDIHTPQNRYLSRPQRESSPSPVSKKQHPSTNPCQRKIVRRRPHIIKDAKCNPMDDTIRKTILKSIDPPLPSYIGYHEYSNEKSKHAAEIQKFVKALKKRSRSSDSESFDPPILCLSGADRSYAIKRELGAGAFAPVYLVESSSNDIGSDAVRKNNKRSLSCDGESHSSPITNRQILEAIKMEVESPSAWEFYMIRVTHDRLQSEPALARATESIIHAHEFHLFRDEAFLVEDYCGQGTLLDLVNIVRADTLTGAGNNEVGMDEALVMFFAVELFRTIESLHACEILHGDVKPDNCLVRFDTPTSPTISSVEPSLIDLGNNETIADPREVSYSPRGLFDWRKKGLTLIDFGRAVDLRAFQPTVQFIADWETGTHECNEIREMRPWTYQIDLYGVAGTIHVMLFGKHIESVQLGRDEPEGSNRGLMGSPGAGNIRRYRIRESLKRYWDREIWSDVFDLLLNPGADRWVQMELAQGSNQSSRTTGAVLPVLQSMKYVRERMESWLVSNAEKKGLSSQIRKLEIHLSKRKEKLDKEK